jgi:hypothetical protein
MAVEEKRDTAISFTADGGAECLRCHAQLFVREAAPELRSALSLDWAKAHRCAPAESAGLAYLRNRGIGLQTSAKGAA